MTREEREIKILKRLVVAQARMIKSYRIGSPKMPEWVFDAINSATDFYGVLSVDEIK